MTDLLTQRCEPITSKSEALAQDQVNEYLVRFDDWQLVEIADATLLQRTFTFGAFTEAAQFATEVGKHADNQHHHPVIILDNHSAQVRWWTHSLGGLHKNDFIMAAHTDDVYARWALISGAKDNVDEASDESFPASDPPGF